MLCIVKQERVSHESKCETSKLGCRHLDKTKPEKLVTQKKNKPTLEQDMARAIMAREGNLGPESLSTAGPFLEFADTDVWGPHAAPR